MLRHFTSFAAIACLGLTTLATAADAPGASKTDAKVETIDVFGEFKMTVPKAFKRSKLGSRILEHEFVATAGEGDAAKKARVTFMAAGGGVKPNIDRWMGQFSGGDKDAQKTDVVKVGKLTVHVVDCSGRFGEKMGGGPFAPGRTIQRTDYAMAGAIMAHPEGRLYFVKMIGPASVVKANRADFVKMVKSVGE